ncbi:MAG: diadenylate cyclase CdaA [Phycisphaeraceae bacterium]|nr:diadenylate cyclase CdaA [Phycisphaeraceae bacterium]
MKLDRLYNLLDRLTSYPLWEVGVELLLIGLVVYAVARFVRGTRAAGALKGIFVILLLATLVARVFGGGETFQRLAFLYDRFLAIVAVGLLIIFQPELRRALIRLGETGFFSRSSPQVTQAVDAIADAAAYLSKSRFGAIVVIQRKTNLQGIVEGGTVLDAALTSPLLKTIFFPGTALHDLAVVIKGNVVHAAGVQLPLADPGDMPEASLGSRHRAALGLTKESDALVIIVSEETGHIRISENGKLSEPIARGDLADELLRRLNVSGPAGGVMPEAQTAQEQNISTMVMSPTVADTPTVSETAPLKRAEDAA